MGERFDALPVSVRQIHSVLRDDAASGEAKVTGAANALGAFVARIMRFPPAGQYKLHVTFIEREGVEHWTRAFGAFTFSSTLSEAAGNLVERFGPIRFKFDLPSNECGLEMRMRGWSVWRVPLPLFLAPQSRAREWEEDGRFCFEVPIALPLVGRIVHYRGSLVPHSVACEPEPTAAFGSALQAC